MASKGAKTGPNRAKIDSWDQKEPVFESLMRGAPTHPFEEIILPKNMFLAWEALDSIADSVFVKIG